MERPKNVEINIKHTGRSRKSKEKSKKRENTSKKYQKISRLNQKTCRTYWKGGKNLNRKS